MPPDFSANAWAGRRERRLGVCWQLWLSLGGLGGSAAPRGAVTLQPGIGEVTKAGTSVPMHLETTLGVMGGGKRGPEAAASSLRGRQEGRKFPHHFSWKGERAGKRQSWGMGERVGASA